MTVMASTDSANYKHLGLQTSSYRLNGECHKVMWLVHLDGTPSMTYSYAHLPSNVPPSMTRQQQPSHMRTTSCPSVATYPAFSNKLT